MTNFKGPLNVTPVLDVETPEVRITGHVTDATTSVSGAVSGNAVVVDGFVLGTVINTAGTTSAVRIPFFNV